MATLTAVDFANASRYAAHQHRLRFIRRWRNKMPHILIDYEIRPATNDDYYVSPKLSRKAVAVKLTFSERGCNSMSCYPFSETAPADYNTPFGYTQTSDVTVAYAQPACYNLDRAAATREGAENEVQAPELRYAADKCVLMDTMSKLYMNAPYFRTDEHLIKGVDDVPGFNVTPNSDPLFPEMFTGRFNEAYCRRFGRSLAANGGCSLQWWEHIIGFVLGDTIYVTFKLMANNVFSELRNFDYTKPSPELPAKPPRVDSSAAVAAWRSVRDTFVDLELEKQFDEYETLDDLGIDHNTKLIYTAERGYSKTPFLRRAEYRTPKRSAYENDVVKFETTDEEIEQIIMQFLEDWSMLIGIWVSFGFDNVMDALKFALKKINSALIPSLKRMMLTTSRRVTAKLLGETYKAAVVHMFSRLAIKTVSAVAKALTKIAILASSVVGILLIALTITDLIFAIWDPFGYSNMFPRQFPEDLARSFLSAYFESMGETRDIVEFLPEYFDDLVEEDDTATLESLLDILDYVADLEINSNGQMLYLDEGDVVDDIDETTLLGNALSANSMYTKLDFWQYTHRHNDILFANAQFENVDEIANKIMAALWIAGASFVLIHNEPQNRNFTFLFIVFILLAVYLIIKNSLNYYLKLRQYTDKLQTAWYTNLYT
ncbi:p74 [Euproctis pseudoconspersa nucleopolyhedrovirus]|uniref:p74 n=1 Tax=Euproctis pseudoconspersa nucleopolyhedrovirus TaxID=307467 RepID=C3TWS5_9ABAC|nr:p74 [Euproctis pseudoconspersa nucleopolyhedrovirus]ACO53467.1 p74 [Euproctis pseudoconspersa nucleopolyhedrovirus]